MADFRFILVAFGVVWCGLVWFGCSILIWFGGSLVLPAPLGPTLPPTASEILPTTDHGRTKKKKRKKTNGVGYRVAAQLKMVST